MIQIVKFIGHRAYQDRLERFHPMIRRAVETEGTRLSNDAFFDRALNYLEDRPAPEADIFE